MRLLRRQSNGDYKLTGDLPEGQLPRYAILSHTWLMDNEEEVTFDDLTRQIGGFKRGFNKITFCGEQAAKDGLEYFWVDTCCINRGSSTELQEAITSMFAWYRKAFRCYVYLADVSVPVDASSPVEGKQLISPPWEPAFRNSRWFTRGWTLQELLAPACVEFFSAQGTRLGDKQSLEQCIYEVTGIPRRALRGESLTNFSIAERFSWTEYRQTTRKEDKAYCLLGIFNIFMPLMYGEGDHAYARIREEIGKKQEENANIDKVIASLPIAADAAFNSLKNQHEPTCLPNTRTELLQEIEEWADGHDERCIFWLNGIAGTGKSTIARTIARTYHDRGNLGASFFFSRGGGDLGHAYRLITTLARQLSIRVPLSTHYIYEAVLEQQDIAEHSLRDQWDHLILRPLSRLRRNSCPSTIVLVVDALDECDSERDIQVILKILATASSLQNVRLRIFITSRPEIPLRRGIRKIAEAERQVFALHEISPTLVDRDLNLFFETHFMEIREERGFEDDWPGKRVVKRLVEISCGLFIWASTACRFIREGRRLAMRRISILINGHRGGADPEKQLDRIYTTVLEDAVTQGYTEDEKIELYNMLRQVLGNIVILFSPLSIDSLAQLVGLASSHIKETLADLHTIFQIPSQPSQPVRLHHPSFRDFLLDKSRCSNLNFWVNEKQTHEKLAHSCITLMRRMLKRDICGLGSPGTLSENIDPSRVEECIPPELQYACLYWVQHLQQCDWHLSDGDIVHRFFEECFLYWLEAINLMGKSAEMGAIIRLYHSLMNPDDNVRQMPFVKDARRLLFAFQSIINQAPLQTYCVTLAFIPPTNELKLRYQDEFYPWIKSMRVAEAIVPEAKDEFNYVNDVAFSPDGQLIASGSNIPAARLWDVASKAALWKFDGPLDKVSSVAISPDGKILAAGADDFTVRAWNLKTRAVRYILKGHTRWVNQVIFSPNGKLLASGSMDETIALWNAVTGKEVKRFSNQSSSVNTAAYSPDSSSIAVGSVDQMVRLWDVSGGSQDMRLLLDGHSGCINSVRFSPNGKQLVSGSDDKTIKIWDVNTGTEIRTLRGHTKKIMAVTFSLDSRLIVSGGEDMMVKLWDAVSGATLRTIGGHTSGINAVVFSPSGRLMASGSFNDEIRLWETKSWTLQGQLDDFDGDNNPVSSHKDEDGASPVAEFKGHSSIVTCVVFSPDGRTLASGSQDSTIKLWPVMGAEGWRLDGHSGRINHLAFSPNGLFLASASADNTVRLWSTETHVSIHTLEGHSNDIPRVIFSPNGRLIASCSADSTIRLWDLATGEELGVLKGHEDKVIDIAFSPNNRFIASCSVDAKVLAWDVTTKEVFATLIGHSGPVNSIAFSSDSNLLVSSSDDATARLWNTAGTPCGILRGDPIPVTSAALSPDNRLVAYCSINGCVTLWDVETKAAKGSVETGVVIHYVCFSNCGRYLDTDRGTLYIGLFSSPSFSLQATHSYALFMTQDWLKRDEDNVIWVPETYRVNFVAARGKDIVLGHISGAISFVSF